VQENIRKLAGCGLIRNLQQLPLAVPKIVIERVMNDHADKSAHDDERIDIDHGALALAFANVLAQNAIHALHEFFPEHRRQLVLFEGRVQQQPVKLRIAVVLIQSIQREPFEDRAVVLARQRLIDDVQRIHRLVQAGFLIENRAVKLLFGGEMTKHHGL